VSGDVSGASAGTLGKASEPVGRATKMTVKATGTKRKNDTPAAQQKRSHTKLKTSSSYCQKGRAVVEDSDSDAVVIIDANVEMETN
jgi:hypothetical protein